LRFRVLQTMIVRTAMVVVVMNNIVRVLIVVLVELLICAIAVATGRIVSDAGATYHNIASVADSSFVRYFVKLSMSHLFSILVNYIRRTNQYTDARY